MMIFTIGHSDRTLTAFCELLEAHSIRRIVDVRRHPGSRHSPQFNADILSESLAARGIRLDRLEVLTGRRPVSTEVPFEVNAWWEHRSFHNYADHALGAEFADGIRVLGDWGTELPTAVMCAEAVWWRCHRRIIADYVLAAGEPVMHILGAGQSRAAELSAGAVLGGDGRVTYPRAASAGAGPVAAR